MTKVLWLMVSCLMALSIVMAACAPATTSPATPVPSTTTPVTTTPPATPVTPAPAPTPVLKSNPPPDVPHALTGRGNCVLCHQDGIVNAPKVPSVPNHSTLQDSTCLGCHQTGAAGVPKVPADHAGRTACMVCHQNGVANAPKFPADHTGRASDTCLSCHQPSQTPIPTAAPPAVDQVSQAQDGATNVSFTPHFSWAAYPGALWYEIAVSEYSDFTILEFAHNASDNWYDTAGDEALKPGRVYYWRVRGVTGQPYTKGTSVITPAGPWTTGSFKTTSGTP